MFGIGFIGGGIPIGGGGGGTDNPPKPRGIKSSLSSSECRSVKSKSHSVNGRTIFFTNSSQCNSFSDFFGSGFLISWSLLGDLCEIDKQYSDTDSTQNKGELCRKWANQKRHYYLPRYVSFAFAFC